MRPHHRAMLAALGAGAVLGLAAGTGCSTQDCKNMKANGSPFAFMCGAEGDAAPEPTVPALSACQPREVMPVFFSLIDNKDPSFAGLRGALGDLGKAECLDQDGTGKPLDRSCTNDDQCAIGRCGSSGLCPCQTSHSALTDVLGVTLRAMAAIARDPVEAPGLKAPGCLTPAQAAELAPEKRSRICEIRRMLDVLLQSTGGTSLIDDPQVRKVLISLLDYVQGKTDCDPVSGVCKTHYDLLEPVGRMAGVHTSSCDPAALWTLLDNMLGYLTPEKATTQLGALQVLLADPQTKSLLAQLAGQGGSSGGRDGIIVLLHTFTPGLTNPANSAAQALDPILNLLNNLVFSSSNYPQSFKDEVSNALGLDPATLRCPAVGKPSHGGICEMLGPTTGLWQPLQEVLTCAGSKEVRCADPSTCTNNDDELVGALYDILSKKESEGGVDLATLVGALKSLTTLDQTGQTGRTLRLIIQGIEGSADPNDPHEARDAVAELAAQALTASEGKKLVPALSVMIEKQVLGELLDLVHDLLYTCSPPPTTH